MKIGTSPTPETITLFFTLHPEYIQIIENRFRDQYELLETDANYWSSEELTKKAFYMYYGLNNYQKKPSAEIAKDLGMRVVAVENKVRRITEYLQQATKK